MDTPKDKRTKSKDPQIVNKVKVKNNHKCVNQCDDSPACHAWSYKPSIAPFLVPSPAKTSWSVLLLSLSLALWAQHFLPYLHYLAHGASTSQVQILRLAFESVQNNSRICKVGHLREESSVLQTVWVVRLIQDSCCMRETLEQMDLATQGKSV